MQPPSVVIRKRWPADDQQLDGWQLTNTRNVCLWIITVSHIYTYNVVFASHKSEQPVTDVARLAAPTQLLDERDDLLLPRIRL